MGEPLLEIQNLVAAFTSGGQRVAAADDISLWIRRGETLALVGESGCGKSVTALSILRLLPTPPARIERGKILYDGVDLLRLDEPSMRRIRGDRIAMIFQEPMTSLNPVFTVGFQLVEALRLHRSVSKRAARERAVELLDLVGIPAPDERISDYPHQLSGGMRQRVMIAMALSCDPQLLIADEPTTALDVTVQAQILALLQQLQAQRSMGILFITHDLGIVAEFAHQVAVMYAGRVVEQCSVKQLFENPAHPYTRGLLASVPARVIARAGGAAPRRLPTIRGVVPSLAQLPPGCRFRDRCDHSECLGPDAARCANTEPVMVNLDAARAVRCHFPLKEVAS
ncbi:MAG TPA: ABC transporter ATP-binding protein [Polyangiaceae bacterium]|nr:ABC transporter ATP-binding protein [Polyangiaceae bacterium]